MMSRAVGPPDGLETLNAPCFSSSECVDCQRNLGCPEVRATASVVRLKRGVVPFPGSVAWSNSSKDYPGSAQANV